MRGLDKKGSVFNILIGGEGISSRGQTSKGRKREEATTGKRRII